MPDNQLNAAIEVFKKGTNSSRASREFDVPLSAILNHVNGVSKTLEVQFSINLIFFRISNLVKFRSIWLI